MLVKTELNTLIKNMKTELYSNVFVLQVVHEKSRAIKAVMFCDSNKNPTHLLERLFNGCGLCALETTNEGAHWLVHSRGHYYIATRSVDVISKLRAHRGKHYVYICG